MANANTERVRQYNDLRAEATESDFRLSGMNPGSGPWLAEQAKNFKLWERVQLEKRALVAEGLIPKGRWD